ncbi:MAG: methyltransferase domain-containing protein [Caulobacterales bacterium]
MAEAKHLLSRARYAAEQSVRVAWYMAHYTLSKKVAEAGVPGTEPPKRVIPETKYDPKEARRAFLDVFAQDLRNIEEGLYPAPRDLDVRKLTRALDSSRRFLTDLSQVDARRRKRAGRDLPEGIPADDLPAYYAQNFHYQSGGWLTEDSARLYDTQVEVLFTGAADAMRRAALAEIGRELRGKDQRKIKYVDAACGSGRFLAQTLDAFPRLNARAFDLSPAYTAAAREAAKPWPRADVCTADITATPFPDAHFDIAGSVYLFHELPPAVRKQAAAELYRITKPGGLFVFADSVQTDDAPVFARSIERFPDLFHEPYYRSYQRTDLDALFAEAGFIAERHNVAFLTRVATYRRL